MERIVNKRPWIKQYDEMDCTWCHQQSIKDNLRMGTVRQSMSD